MMKTNEDRNVIGVFQGRLEFRERQKMCWRVQGVLGVWGFGQRSVGVSEDGWNGVGGALGG